MTFSAAAPFSVVLWMLTVREAATGVSSGSLWTKYGTFIEEDVQSPVVPRAPLFTKGCMLQCAADPLCAVIEVTEENESCTTRSLPPPDVQGATAFLETSGHVLLQRCIRDCSDAYLAGFRKSGVVAVCPLCHTGGPYTDYCFHVRCNGYGGTIIHYRYDGSVDFTRNWTEYKNGFGNLMTEFWLGLEKVHAIVKGGNYDLLVWLEPFNWGAPSHLPRAYYKEFSLTGEDDNYCLTVSGYTGYPCDGLSPHSGMMFSTWDRDNDIWEEGSCASNYSGGGWWFSNCARSSLNGRYYSDGQSPGVGRGIIWCYGGDPIWIQNSLKSTSMHIRQRSLYSKV